VKLAHADPARWPVAPGWAPTVDAFFASSDGRSLTDFLATRLAQGATVYPPEPLRALALTPPETVRVIILGQDPYHGPGQAEGLAFSVAPGVSFPPSLRNILLERQRDLGLAPPLHGSLAHWAAQGVLLLNTCLSVEDGQPASHAGKGWEVLTDALIEVVTRNPLPKAFLLWGAHAQKKAARIATPHRVFAANHPSPLSARRGPTPFLGCGHFGAVNDWLREQGRAPIDW
jgi:uracil-DNA glycosylase